MLVDILLMLFDLKCTHNCEK